MNVKKFFNLPVLYTYVIAFVLLIALVVSGSGFVKSGLLYLLPASTSQADVNSPDTNITFTADAKAYYQDFADTQNKKFYQKDLLSNGLILLLFLPFFVLHFLRARKIDEENSVPFTVKNLYFYLVCLITFFIAIFSAASAISNVIDYNYQVAKPMPLYEYGMRIQEPAIKEKVPPSNEKIVIDKAKLQQAVKNQQTLYQPFNYEMMISQITMLIVAIPVFLIHWVRIRKLGLPA